MNGDSCSAVEKGCGMGALTRRLRELCGLARREDPPRESADEFYRQVYIQCLKVQRSDRRVRIIFFLVVTIAVIGLAILLSTRGDPINIQFRSLKELLSW